MEDSVWGHLVTGEVTERQKWQPPAVPAGEPQQQEASLRAAFGLRGGKANG